MCFGKFAPRKDSSLCDSVICPNPQGQFSHSGKHSDDNKSCPDNQIDCTYLPNNWSLVSYKLTGEKFLLITKDWWTYEIVGLTLQYQWRFDLCELISAGLCLEDLLGCACVVADWNLIGWLMITATVLPVHETFELIYKTPEQRPVKGFDVN
jgi:hypothetical protein